MKQEVYFKHVSFKVVVRLRCLVECGMGFLVNDANTEINVWIQSCTGSSDDMASIVTLSTWRSLTCSMCKVVYDVRGTQLIPQSCSNCHANRQRDMHPEENAHCMDVGEVVGSRVPFTNFFHH